jgi:transketolase
MIGLKGFGTSGPAEKLMEHFGLTTEKIVEAALTLVK